MPLPEEWRSILEGIWYEETHHSTAIEGNTLVLKEVQLLLFEGRAIGRKELHEYLEVQGYANAAEWVYTQARRDDREPAEHLVSIAEIRQIHALVVEQAWLQRPPDQLDPNEGPGALRRKNIEAFAAGMRPPDWTQVSSLLTDWVDKIKGGFVGGTGRHAMEDVADLHAEFERIHPFRDGNGRVGRLVMNLILVRSGYPPAIIYKQDRTTYLRGLQRADSGDPGLLGELLARAVKNSIDRFILPGLAGPHRLVPLSALTDKVLSHNALVLAAQRGRLQATQRRGQWYSSQRWVETYKASRYQRRRGDSP